MARPRPHRERIDGASIVGVAVRRPGRRGEQSGGGSQGAWWVLTLPPAPRADVLDFCPPEQNHRTPFFVSSAYSNSFALTLGLSTRGHWVSFSSTLILSPETPEDEVGEEVCREGRY